MLRKERAHSDMYRVTNKGERLLGFHQFSKIVT